jgi:hypothetical protein
MIHTKRVIFMILPLLFVPLVYGMSSTPDACAVPSRVPGTYKCGPAPYPAPGWQKCCWTETDPDDPEGIELYYCHICAPSGRCGEKFPGSSAPTPPTFDPAAPLQEGVLEQLPDQPPLFGRNEGAAPPTGGIEQPFTSTTPPLFGNIPQGGGFGVLQEPETPPFGQVAPLVQKPTTETPTTPLPTPTPPPPDFAPQDNQGGGLPTIENQENVPPGGGVTEQPEDDGQQEDSPEGAPTAGPLT